MRVEQDFFPLIYLGLGVLSLALHGAHNPLPPPPPPPPVDHETPISLGYQPRLLLLLLNLCDPAYISLSHS